MSSLWKRVEPLLARVQKPARYIGCEDGATTPRHDKLPNGGTVAWLLAYPDTYEIGLPNQGLQILYEILNERDDAVAERTYAPWLDLSTQMRTSGVPLFSVDTHRPASDFDILAFNLSSELVFTNVLEMIDLAGIPLHTADRGPTDSLVMVGGHAAFNPEPLADFIDAAVLGEGEEVVADITDLVRDWKLSGRTSREGFLRELSKIPGVYVPSMYEVAYDGERIAEVRPRFADVPPTVDKRTVADLGDWPYLRNPLVPLTEVVHDRLSVEVFRGCTRGCRFCQAGMITRPVRERPADQVRTMIRDGLKRTGYDEVSLTSLSTADFSGIEPVVRGVLEDAALPGGCGTDTLTINLPSLRVDAFTVGLAGEVNNGRRSGLTFAPEAGSWRLRQVINKLILEEDLYGAVDSAFSQGWTRMKLYFLTGLPTETDDDTLGIAELAKNCVAIGKKHTGRASVTVSLGGFVPKPHTPFQWFGQNTEIELQRKVDLVRTATRRAGGVNLKWHDPWASVAEGIATRGDRRIGRVIERVWRDGGVFQEWGEHFDLRRWRAAMEAEGLSIDWYVFRHRDEHEILPWDHLTAGLHKDFLWGDWQDALAGSGIEDCRWTPCYDCGVCTGYGIEHVVASPIPPAGGSQGTGQDLSKGAEVPVSLLPPRRGGAGSRGAGVIKLRIRATKLGKVRFTSHRDAARLWERALRRADLPVAASEGFTPRPKISFGLALPTGAESTAEYVDVDLREPIPSSDVDTLPAILSAALPVGFDVLVVAERSQRGSLQEIVTACTWELWSPQLDLEQHRDACRLLEAASLVLERERKGKRSADDVRSMILDLRADSTPAGDRLVADLASGGRGLRPSELAQLAYPHLDPVDVRVLRTHQWTDHDGIRRDVLPYELPLPAAVAASPIEVLA